MEQKNIYIALAAARVAVQKRLGKKSGHNDYAGYDYYELKDFLPQANEELANEGLCAVFYIDLKEVSEGTFTEYAYLDIHDAYGNVISFYEPTAEAVQKGSIPIQVLGSKNTYMKRYLYMNALEIAEPDAVDATIGKEKQEQANPSKSKQTEANQSKSKQEQANPTSTEKATAKQIEYVKKILGSEERIRNMMNYYQITKLEDLTIAQASTIIQKKGQQ